MSHLAIHKVKARGLFLAIAIIGFVVGGAAPSFAATPAKKKPLSFPTVDINGPASAAIFPAYVALKRGYFAQNGVTATVDMTATGSAATLFSAFLAGVYQFAAQGTSTGIQAVASGADLKAVLMTTEGSPDELIFLSNRLAALGIPAVATTQSQIAAQFKDLKGTHVKIAVSALSSAGVFILMEACNYYGLTCAVNNPNDDINIQVAGSTGVGTAGVQTGKFDAFAGNPVSTVGMTGASPIQYGLLYPHNKSSAQDLLVTGPFLRAHKDTVQAVVNSWIQAMNYLRNHPASAARYFAQMMADGNVTTNPDVVAFLYAGGNGTIRTPLLLKKPYQLALQTFNAATIPAVNVPYNAFNDNSFVEKGLKQLNLKFPTTP